jgi:hypothetical protein
LGPSKIHYGKASNASPKKLRKTEKTAIFGCTYYNISGFNERYLSSHFLLYPFAPYPFAPCKERERRESD